MIIIHILIIIEDYITREHHKADQYAPVNQPQMFQNERHEPQNVIINNIHDIINP